MLKLCVAQQLNELPYTFRTTGTRVYTIEEALYHVYHFWRESIDDFVSEPMVTWVAALGHSYIASRMKDIARGTQFKKCIIDFLQVVDYFTAAEIASISQELDEWEMRREWEKLKERADYLVGRGEPLQAIPIYKRALQFEPNIGLLNNISVAHMQLGLYTQAMQYLAQARNVNPGSLELLYHYAEAAMLSGNLESAQAALEEIARVAPNSAELLFMCGLYSMQQRDFAQAINYLAQAIEAAPKEAYYAYTLADVYTKTRQYQNAIAAIATTPKDAKYFEKESDIYFAAGDTTAAIASLLKAMHPGRDATMWAKLAKLYRSNYDWQNAEESIAHALAIAPDNDKVRLENARIKKGLGRMRDFQAELTAVLKNFKDRYRVDNFEA